LDPNFYLKAMRIVAPSLLLLSTGGRLVSEAFVIVQHVQHNPKGSVDFSSRNWKDGTQAQKLLVLGAAATSADLVKKAGGGIPLQPGGDRRLFDPDEEGKLAGTSNINDRLSLGPSFRLAAAEQQQSSSSSSPAATIMTTPPANAVLEEAQHWLEDIGLPLNFAKPTAPTTATVLGRIRLITPDAPGDIQHIVLRLPENMHYVEGQSLSVIPPGVDPTSGKPHKPRLYSIASTRYGDLLDGQTVSLCVRRAQYVDPVTGVVDDSKKGACSNWLCDSKPGDVVQVAGPTGKTMLLPHDPNRDIIMVATGTGTSF
jgi:sulfite reductase alpha subunit-like flavoprotein